LEKVKEEAIRSEEERERVRESQIEGRTMLVKGVSVVKVGGELKGRNMKGEVKDGAVKGHDDWMISGVEQVHHSDIVDMSICPL